MVPDSLKQQAAVTEAAASLEAESRFTSRAKAARARLIGKVCEADPLAHPKCQGPLRVIALIDDPAVVRCRPGHSRCATDACRCGFALF